MISENLLKVLLIGIPTEDEIKEDLEDLDYPPAKVVVMEGKNGSAPINIQSSQNGVDYASKTRNDIIQSHECQIFGHVVM